MQTALGDAGMQGLILGRRVFLVSDQWDIGFQLFQQGGAPLWGGGGALIEEGAPIPGGAQAQQHSVRLGAADLCQPPIDGLGHVDVEVRGAEKIGQRTRCDVGVLHKSLLSSRTY